MSATLAGHEGLGRPMPLWAGPSSAFERLTPKPVKVRVEKEQAAPRWLDYVMQRLNALSDRLGEPEEGSAPLADPRALERALEELRTALGAQTPSPSVVPTVEGGVQFVWHQAGWDIEIEVLPHATEVWGRNRQTATRWAGNLESTRPQLRDALQDIESVALAARG